MKQTKTKAKPPDKPTVKPRLRGISHLVAAFASVIAGARLVTSTPGARADVGCLIYAMSLTSLFAVSALYHVPTWQPWQRAWLRRADHAAIYLLIAGTFTPLCLLAIPGERGTWLLTVVWTGAVLGIAKEFFWLQAPKVLTVVIYLALGWVGGLCTSDLHESMGLTGLLLFLVGGVFYSTGAVVYALKRPNPAPATFGYHEIFHLLVIFAAAMHFTAIARFIRHVTR